MQQNVIEFMSCEYVPTSTTLGKKKGGWRQDVVPRSVVPGVYRTVYSHDSLAYTCWSSCSSGVHLFGRFATGWKYFSFIFSRCVAVPAAHLHTLELVKSVFLSRKSMRK